MGKLFTVIFSFLLLAGCATKFDVKVLPTEILGVPAASVQEESKNPWTHNRSQTTLVVKDKEGNLKVLASSHHGNDGVMQKGTAGFMTNTPIGVGLGTMYLGRAPDTTSVSTNVQGTSGAVTGPSISGAFTGPSTSISGAITGPSTSISGATSTSGAVSGAVSSSASTSGNFSPITGF